MLLGNTALIFSVYVIGISLILLFNEINFRLFHVKTEYARKMAHVIATLATIPFPYLFSSHWHVFGLAILFLGVLSLTHKTKNLNSIHGVRRRTYGSYLLVAAIYLTFLIYTLTNDPVLYLLPITILAICDPMAAIVGMSLKKFNKKLVLPGFHSEKTIMGSLAFLVSSGLITAGILFGFYSEGLSNIIGISIAVAIVSTLAELFSWRGSDNLTIPLSVQLALILLL